MFLTIINSFNNQIELININECWLIAPGNDEQGGTRFLRKSGKETHATNTFFSIMTIISDMQGGKI